MHDRINRVLIIVNSMDRMVDQLVFPMKFVFVLVIVHNQVAVSLFEEKKNSFLEISILFQVVHLE
jgi:hypothetical protein